MFRAGAEPPGSTRVQADVIDWTGTPVDPPGTKKVLRLGNGPRNSRAYLMTAITGNPSMWPAGSIRHVYHITAEVLVADGFTVASGNSLLSLVFKDGSGNVIPFTVDKDGSALPLTRNTWTTVSMNVVVESISPVATIEVTWGGNIISTAGSAYMTDLGVYRTCPGLPPGQGLWFRGDRGPPQNTPNTPLLEWDDVTTGNGGRFHVPTANPAQAPSLKHKCLNGYPCIAFAPAQGYLLDETRVPSTSDMTIFLIERYSGPNRGRLLQSPGECVASDGKTRTSDFSSSSFPAQQGTWLWACTVPAAACTIMIAGFGGKAVAATRSAGPWKPLCCRRNTIKFEAMAC